VNLDISFRSDCFCFTSLCFLTSSLCCRLAPDGMAREEPLEASTSMQNEADRMANVAAACLSGDIGLLMRPVRRLLNRQRDVQQMLRPFHRDLNQSMPRRSLEKPKMLTVRSQDALKGKIKHCLKPKVSPLDEQDALTAREALHFVQIHFILQPKINSTCKRCSSVPSASFCCAGKAFTSSTQGSTTLHHASWWAHCIEGSVMHACQGPGSNDRSTPERFINVVTSLPFLFVGLHTRRHVLL
jgi:hypothetical protein